MASALHWIPDSLYNTSIAAVVSCFSLFKNDLKTFPGNVLFDVYYKLYKEGSLCQLGFELSNLRTFESMLRVHDKRYLLHHCFQAVMDHGYRITQDLSNAYEIYCISNGNPANKDRKIKLGLLLGDFLSDAGWYTAAEAVLVSCVEFCKTLDPKENYAFFIECYMRLLHVRNIFSNFHMAEQTFNEAQELVKEMESCGFYCNLAGLYTQYSAFYFCRSNYDEAYQWTLEALKELGSCRNVKVAIQTMRQASRTCVVKRKFKKAEMLIEQALQLSRQHFGHRNPVMANTLIDYGFFLVNVDRIGHSLEVYQAALEARQCIFGGQNLLVAIVHEDLAYAMYINNYSNGSFNDARDHVEKAIQIMQKILPENHFLLASTKRIKALILEEIGMDSHDKATERRMLLEAQELHMSALRLAEETFGEMNVQTAKHYGNLGRLYQSMQNFQKARTMHLKSIKIKEEILGPFDYEMAVSVGHLASLYNYDLDIYDKAEELYLRAISIGTKLFGNTYRGLEFDYRGLVRVYQALGNEEKANHYQELLWRWKVLRNKMEAIDSETSPLKTEYEVIPLEIVYDIFMTTQ